MNYNIIYNNLIEKAKKETRVKKKGIYYESHHIIPKCIGGSNDKSNLVLLTAKEHYLAHLLLIKINPDNNGLVFAWHSMSRTGGNNSRGRFSGREYSFARKLHSELLSSIMPEIGGGCKNRYWLKKGQECIRVYSDELEKYFKLGYVKGRIINSRKSPSEETKLKIGLGNSGKTSWQKGNPSKNKGKTYEEIHGVKKALELKEIRRLSIININKNKKNAKTN